MPKSQIIIIVIIIYLILIFRGKTNYNPEGLFHDEQVKTGVTLLLSPSRLRPETRDYNNGPPLNTHILTHTTNTHVYVN